MFLPNSVTLGIKL